VLIYLFQILGCLLNRLGFGSGPQQGAQNPGAQRNVVILGGGVAGVAAAFWLTAPEQNNRYKVTLCTQGWRLGGKCASGRNQARHDSIEEHGLHLLMGCYQNAFMTLRACYDAWQRPTTHPFQTWKQAFLPQRQITLMERDGPGALPAWSVWDFSDFPAFPGEPGDEPFLAMAAALQAARPAGPETLRASQNPLVLRMVERMRAVQVPLTSAQSYGKALDALKAALEVPSVTTAAEALAAVSASLADLAQRKTGEILQSLAADEAPSIPATLLFASSRWGILANLGLAIGYGYVHDILLQGDQAYDALDTLDFREWLRRSGATNVALASAPVRAVYDLAFAFPGGNAASIDNGSMAAGVTVRFVLEVTFGYKEAPLWRMAAGTGDTVFTPLYQVLESRGALIQFFHRVTDLRPTADGSHIGEIHMSQQAATKAGTPYKPLRKVGSLDCWPSQPDWDQLENGQTLQAKHPPPDYESSLCTESVGSLTLRNGKDFDLVIAALPPEALKKVGSSLVAVSPAWKTALNESRSVATRALQVWMRRGVAALGWKLGPTVMTSFAEPYDSWGDMSAVLQYENWPFYNKPGSVACFCGCMTLPLTGPVTPATMQQLVAAEGQQWLEANISALWPGAPAASGWWTGGTAMARYDKANVDTFDLYVQTPHGVNIRSRFRSSEPAGFANLYVVGDWTKTRFSGGCFESAVESAMLAANAITGFPSLSTIKTS
jgi:uncharacterized protein with NAD-binding domain and iron-sulfur cluster